jgi:hypothetical protein
LKWGILKILVKLRRRGKFPTLSQLNYMLIIFVCVGGDWLKRRLKKVWRLAQKSQTCTCLGCTGPSSWLDSSLSWPSRPDLSLPLLFRHRRRLPWPEAVVAPLEGTTTLTSADVHVAASLPGRAPRWLDEKRSKKVYTSVVLLVASPHRLLTLERWPPRRTRLPLRVSKPQRCTASTSATSASKDYHLHRMHTSLYSSHNIHTLTTLRLQGDFSSSPPTFSSSSSLIVCGAPVVIVGNVKVCVPILSMYV